MESFADNKLSLDHVYCIIGLSRGGIVRPVSLADLFSSVLNTFPGQKPLQGREVRQFWNLITKKVLEVEDERLLQPGVAQC